MALTGLPWRDLHDNGGVLKAHPSHCCCSDAPTSSKDPAGLKSAVGSLEGPAGSDMLGREDSKDSSACSLTPATHFFGVTQPRVKALQMPEVSTLTPAVLDMHPWQTPARLCDAALQ